MRYCILRERFEDRSRRPRIIKVEPVGKQGLGAGLERENNGPPNIVFWFRFHLLLYLLPSLRSGRNRKPFSNGLNEQVELCFKFPFNLIAYYRSCRTIVFLTDQSWRVLKYWYAAGGPEQGFWHWLADGLDQRFGFVSDAGYLLL